MDKRVSIIRCENYSNSQNAVDKAIELLGGIEKFVKKGDKVLIKPNFVMKKDPREAATTHPEILRAVIKAAQKAGGEVTVAESPGGPYNQAALKSLYAVCGAEDAVKDTGAKLNFDTSFSEEHYPDGRTIKNVTVINPVLNADVIISVSKLKTHAMTGFTGAVKNIFGVIPGTHKAEMHFRLKERKPFCSMLADLYELVKPTLSIMDGVWGMEGDGPTAGQNRHIGLVLASANGHALDMAACKIIDYKPEEIETVREGIERGLIPESAEQLEILGEDINSLIIKDFVKPQSHFNLLRLLSLPASLNAKLNNVLSSRPVMVYGKCIGCGECSRCCPPKAIEMVNGKPVIDKDKCIKCFCCQELCPREAVKIHRPLPNRIMLKLLK